MNNKKILYIDMDDVLVNFQTGIDRLDEATRKEYEGRMDEVPGIFSLMLPKEDVKKYLGESAYKRLILTHHKNLNKGDFLVDDKEKNGAGEFNGEFIHFGKEKFPDWKSVKAHLLNAQ